MDTKTIFTALDMTYGILASMTVQGAHNVKALANALTNIEEIMKAVNDYHIKMNGGNTNGSNDSNDGQGEDVRG